MLQGYVGFLLESSIFGGCLETVSFRVSVWLEATKNQLVIFSHSWHIGSGFAAKFP